jgi:hypothetical protein
MTTAPTIATDHAHDAESVACPFVKTAGASGSGSGDTTETGNLRVEAFAGGWRSYAVRCRVQSTRVA